MDPTIAQVLPHLQTVDAAVRSPEFQNKCDDFLNGQCDQFLTQNVDGSDPIHWTSLHGQYEQLVELEILKVVGEV